MRKHNLAAAIVAMAALFANAVPCEAAPPLAAIVVQDRAALRAAPRDSGQEQALLWQGEMVEVRGERLDYLQIYDHRRERAGFIRASQVRRIRVASEEATELLSVMRFLRDTPGAEALGIGYAAAFIEAAPADTFGTAAGMEALDVLGTLADRLARRASQGAPQNKAMAEAITAHLEVAASYGIVFTSIERDNRMLICYDGDAFRRLLSLRSSAEQVARAALALSRQDCMDPDLRPTDKSRLDEWRAEVLDRADIAQLPPYLRNRVLMSRAGVLSSIAYQQTRKGGLGAAAAQRAIEALAGVDKSQLTDDDWPAYNDAAMRVSASRWAAATGAAAPGKGLRVVADAGEAGETCIAVIDSKGGSNALLARRCTYGLVWIASTTWNREGTAMAIAVQQTDAWREIWVFRKQDGRWTAGVLPPASASPNLGYVEFAGWVPGGKEMLVAREARADGKYRRTFEVIRLDGLATERQANDATTLLAFRRWQDPGWKRATMSIR